ncbi:MAG: divalent-cation tolerance protein CutA [Alphaproteobacteria bacterium]|nr:divalent-cation tolerance protein CutA [Alphaproteobacteria bacterium]
MSDTDRDPPRLVYVTAATGAEALMIGRSLVEARLAASVNVLGGARSIYWWEGRIEVGEEAVLVAKTRGTLVDPLIAHVRTLHSYACPAIVVLPVLAGNPDYLAWIAAETKEAGNPP